jgi:glycosyltransferase involved in cell wall biosynthesis
MSMALAGEFEVHVFCLDEPGRWAADLRASGISVQCLWRQPGLDLSMSLKLARSLRAIGAQIVHAHQCTPWFYAALSRLLYPRPRLLLEEHGRFFPEKDQPWRRLVNRLLISPLTHHCVAVSEDVGHRLERYEGLSGAKIEIIYNGVSELPLLPMEARSRLRRELGFDAADFVVGTVGRFDPIKNLAMLIQSLAAARLSDRRLRGLLVGDGPEFASIRELIKRLGLADCVQLTGFRADARSIVQCMDLFVLSSVSEGTSMALLEAMAAGVPAVVTAVGGNPEVVRAGETGWVIPSGAVDALTAAILTAAGDAGLRNRFAVQGRKRFESCFTFEAMMRRYRHLYSSLLAIAQ